MADTLFEALPPGRQTTTVAATEGCWEGTRDMVGAVVHESRNRTSWKPHRAALAHVMAGQPGVHMLPSEFFLWRKMARKLARLLGREETPMDDIGFTTHRYNDLGSESRTKRRGLVISRIEALACAHYVLGFEKPCDPAGLKDWFWPRFGAMTHICAWLDTDPTEFSGQIEGSYVKDGVRQQVVASGALIRALDWVHRFGPVCPYGERPDVVTFPMKEST